MGRCSSWYVIHLVWDYATYPIFLPPFRPFSSSYFLYLAADCVSIVGQDPSVFPIVGISAVFFTWFFQRIHHFQPFIQIPIVGIQYSLVIAATLAAMLPTYQISALV